jgi:glycosyltransferase involved in cell wall biosynthesis
MKVGLVWLGSGCRGTERDGPDAPVQGLARGLAAIGHEPVIYTGRWAGRQDAPDGCRIVPLPAGPRTAPADDRGGIEMLGDLVDRLRPALTSDGCDVVHGHGWLAGLALHLARREAGPPRVYTPHPVCRIPAPRTARGLPTERGVGTRGRAEMAIIEQVDALVVQTHAEADALVRTGVQRARIRVVPHGLSSGVERASARRVGPGRLVAFGGAESAAACVRALEGLPGAELVLVDDGWAASATGALRELADRAEPGIAVHIQRLRTAEERRDLIGSADAVACLPSDHSCGIECLEAMAAGVPVLAGNASAQEAVTHRITGLHLADRKPRTLAKMVRELWASPATAQAVTVAARDHVLSRHTWERIAAETAETYARVRVAEPELVAAESTAPAH